MIKYLRALLSLNLFFFLSFSPRNVEAGGTETPVYVYSKRQILQNIRNYKMAFRERSAVIGYSVKVEIRYEKLDANFDNIQYEITALFPADTTAFLCQEVSWPPGSGREEISLKRVP